jgi:hypothetical protein
VQPIDGGAPARVTRFESGELFGFDWGAGERSVVCARVTEARRVVVLRLP